MSKVGESTARHVMVSGGSRGLGQALVSGLLDAGYKVSTFSRRPTDFTDSLQGRDRFFHVCCDVSAANDLNEYLSQAQAKLGPVYGLINCAGIAIDGVLAGTKEEDIESMMRINLLGTLILTRLVIRQLLLRPGGGSIIMISSIIGTRGYSGLAAYAATKGGMDSAMRALARELGSRNIRVNSIAPGYLETEMTHGLGESQLQQIIRRTPLNRLGRPEDVVGPALFLLSDAAQFVTGQTLVVDGGITT